GNGPAGNTGSPGGTTSNPAGNTGNPGGTIASGGTTKASGGNTSNPGGTTSNPGGTTGSSGGTTKASGGSTTATGGTTSPGGTTGSSAGSTGSTTNPPGYWTYKDWKGCAWARGDGVVGATTVSPTDFTAHKDGDPYCVQGTVYNDYNSVALLGFNLNEASTGSATQCAAKTVDPNASGPPTATMGGTGLAINFTKTTAPTFRVQLTAPDGFKSGAAGDSGRWCYTITDPKGPIFVPYTKFNSKCWEVTAISNGTGTFYNGTTPIDAVVFTVPGTIASPTPYNFCVNGFAGGTSVADAPGGGSTGPSTGTIGGPNNTAANYQRVKVGAGGKSYVIQNNNWGNSGSGQTITYSDNSFKITATTGNGSSAPASFPSIFIGGNGDTQNGNYSTTGSDNLPIQVSAIKSVSTSFSWSGGAGGKDFNATYDVWFASSKPGAGLRYDDAISGFVMVWLYDPPNHQPIGSVQRQASIAGHNWDVWVGPRGTAAAGTDGASRPVVSYVSKDGSLGSLTFDLNAFIKDAASNGILSNWYLTDVFAGFEIWTGSDSANLACTGFTCVVQ
ncbi:MAG TPA: hypothetical protein VJ860_14130, partial [Polyangia bacterium]|nr:hypothetical protein [Polyangia bacterium]